MMTFTRQIHVHMDQQRRRTWRSNQQCLEMQDSTVTIVGLGDISSATAHRAKALGAHVLAVRRGGTASQPPFVDEVYDVETLDEALGRSDYVVSALPSTPQTRGFLSPHRIARMKPEAVFVNVGRGDRVQEMIPGRLYGKDRHSALKCGL